MSVCQIPRWTFFFYLYIYKVKVYNILILNTSTNQITEIFYSLEPIKWIMDLSDDHSE